MKSNKILNDTEHYKQLAESAAREYNYLKVKYEEVVPDQADAELADAELE